MDVSIGFTAWRASLCKLSMSDRNFCKEKAMISNLPGLFRKIIEQTITKSPSLGAALSSQDVGAIEEYVTEVLSDWLAAIFERNKSSQSNFGASSEESFPPDMVAWYDALAERNAALAAALGACDCWGGLADCPVCHGSGRPGWRLPEKKSFSYFVQPAISRLKSSSNGATQAQRHVSNGELRVQRH